ncbi:MAG: hypothetical protein BWZ10_00232 [candidate division BRC1 bacterium ADurb.BinA364]|nr:MAG: hypothetical protein BWZ10_00232 [candidate division BRC1 bacterium ADurb.BinA364]
MKACVDIDAGICGFKTSAGASSPDGQMVAFDIESDCDNIKGLAAALKELEPIDAFREIHPAAENILLPTARAKLKGCCSGCVVPAGLFKAMQVAAGLALPRDIVIALRKE